MGLITRTAEAYYNQQQSFTGNGSTTAFTLTTAFFPTLPTAKANIDVFVDGKLINSANYSYSSPTITFSANTNNADQLLSNGAPKNGLNIIVKESAKAERFGGYRYIPLADIINNYIIAFVGDGKLIQRTNRTEVLFHAKRGIQEFAYDISRIEKIQEVEISSSLSVPFPQDYVNYVQISRVDDAGIEHILYPARHTSAPSESIAQDDDLNYLFDGDGNLLTMTPYTSEEFKKLDHNNVAGAYNNDDLTYDNHKDIDRIGEFGKRYGLNPELSQKNGVFVIDELNGKFSFSADLANKIITIKYISDGLGTDDEMQVHKLAEDAIYKYITHAIASSQNNFPEYIINRFRKERRAAMRNAKLRLSNIKLGELAQVMRNKSKHIKH
jgi:hypothetical protein